jgi:hypothetical protein
LVKYIKREGTSFPLFLPLRREPKTGVGAQKCQEWFGPLVWSPVPPASRNEDRVHRLRMKRNARPDHPHSQQSTHHTRQHKLTCVVWPPAVAPALALVAPTQLWNASFLFPLIAFSILGLIIITGEGFLNYAEEHVRITRRSIYHDALDGVAKISPRKNLGWPGRGGTRKFQNIGAPRNICATNRRR